MAGVSDIKHRIQSVTNTQHITKAVKMVAASKLRKTQSAVMASRPYAAKLEEVLGRLINSVEHHQHPLLNRRLVKRVGMIVITADRGLAGGYNANLLRQVLTEAARFEAEVVYITVGRKGRSFLRRQDKTILSTYVGIHDVPDYSTAHHIGLEVMDLFTEGRLDEVYLMYQEFISAVQQSPVIKKLLPITLETEDWAPHEPYIYEPPPRELLELLLPKYVNTVIYQALMEAKASEFGSRMTAMSAATDNAEELIAKLKLSFNRARQGAITQEIAEIVGGSNAL